MKKKYMVGFFLALFCMVLLVSAGYAASYRYVMQRQEARVEEAEKREEDFLQHTNFPFGLLIILKMRQRRPPGII